MRSFAAKNWLGLVSVVFSLSVLLYVLLFTQDTNQLSSISKNINNTWFVLGILCMVAYWVLDGYVLHSLTKLKYKRHSILKSLKTSMIGLLYSAITPFAVGGQPMQIVQMSKNGIDAGDAGSFITIKSIIYQLCLTLYALVSIIFSAGFFIHIVPHFVLFVVVGFVLNLTFIVLVTMICINKKLTASSARVVVEILQKLRILRQKEKILNSIYSQIDIFHKSAKYINKDKNIQLVTFLLTVLQLTFFYVIPYCIYRSFHLSSETIVLVVAAEAIITMITAFIPLPGASGVAEGGFYLFFATFFTKITVIPAVFLWRLITYYSCIFVGGLLSFHDIISTNKKASN